MIIFLLILTYSPIISNELEKISQNVYAIQKIYIDEKVFHFFHFFFSFSVYLVTPRFINFSKYKYKNNQDNHHTEELETILESVVNILHLLTNISTKDFHEKKSQKSPSLSIHSSTTV